MPTRTLRRTAPLAAALLLLGGCSEVDPESLIDPEATPRFTAVAIDESTRVPGRNAELSAGETVSFSTDVAWQVAAGPGTRFVQFDVDVWNGDEYLGTIRRETLETTRSEGTSDFSGSARAPSAFSDWAPYTHLGFWAGLYDEDGEFMASDSYFVPVRGASARAGEEGP